MNEVRELPSDVWVEILRRIPAADLLPLKAVCKTFHRLISDDLFTRLHLNHFTKLHPKATKALVVSVGVRASHSHYEPYNRRISVWHNNEPRFEYKVIDSCRGVLLIVVHSSRLLLYNPITRSHKFLPNICDDFWDHDCWKIVYDDVTEQYKVFSFKFIWPKRMLTDLYVFDVNRDEESHHPRQKTACDSPTKLGEICRDAVLVNGSVYWLFITKGPEPETRIISVNVTTEEVKTQSCSIAILHGRLTLHAANGTFYRFETPYHNYNIKLWVLEGIESENPSWEMKHILDIKLYLTSTLSPAPNFLPILRVGGVFCNKVLIGKESGEGVFQYDMISKEFEEVTFVARGRNSNYRRIIDHIDSLISP